VPCNLEKLGSSLAKLNVYINVMPSKLQINTESMHGKRENRIISIYSIKKCSINGLIYIISIVLVLKVTDKFHEKIYPIFNSVEGGDLE
jgi:translation elongation factor EF-1beta